MPAFVNTDVLAEAPAAIDRLNVHAPPVCATAWLTVSLFTNFTVSPAAIVSDVGDGPWLVRLTLLVAASACGTKVSAHSSKAPSSVASRRPVTASV